MKKLVLFTIVILNQSIALTQNIDRILTSLAKDYDLTVEDIQNYQISNDYQRKETDMRHIYLQQTVNGVPIFNAILQLHLKHNDKLIFHNSKFVSHASRKVDTQIPVLTLDQAFEFVLSKLSMQIDPSCLPFKAEVYPAQLICPAYFLHPVRGKQVYFLQDNTLLLAYEFALEQKKGAAYSFIISATDGAILRQQNRTITCQFDHEIVHSSECKHQHFKSENEETDINRALGEAIYNAYPLLIESPIHGPRALLNAVEFPAASPFGWHDTNGSPGAEYTITRGNNVYAHEDVGDLNEPGYAPDGGLNLVFDFPYLPSENPLLSMDASITNLFVWNNFLHDISFFYGFDEVSGNFQQINYSGLGEGDDFVFAHALDGSGTNNANFGTPEEGLNPYMQMYVWEHIVGNLLEITAPVSIANSYTTGSSTFGVPPPTIPFSSEIILVNDGSSAATLGCGTLINSNQLSGKIAFFDRGGCTFVQKVLNAQNAGAVAAIIANNQQGGAMSMGGTGNPTIPVVSISQEDGDLIKAQLTIGTSVLANFGGSFEFITHDSSFDNGIIAHEYGHGISNCLTGGAYQVDCLWNAEQMGEGWSDFFSLIVSDTLGATAEMPRGIGNFASNRPADGLGIRPFPYTTDMGINPLTYANISELSIPHGLGSVWATMIWDMYWAFVEEYGHSNNIFATSGGNNMAIRLVMEGMRLQVCEPGFVDGRDAILAADQVLYNGNNQCLIWKTFARRGLGYNADQGLSGFVGDETEDFEMPPFCLGVGIEKLDLPEFVVYPNPGTDQLQIKSTNQYSISHVRVTDLAENLITQYQFAESSCYINTSDWSNGLYLIHIQGIQSTQVLRWVKQ